MSTTQITTVIDCITCVLSNIIPPILPLIYILIGIFVKDFMDLRSKKKKVRSLRILLKHDIENDLYYLKEIPHNPATVQFFKHRKDILPSVYTELLLLSSEEMELVLDHYSSMRNLTSFM